MKDNILVTGACGQLGSCIRRLLRLSGENDRYIFSDVVRGVEDTEYLDITDADSVSEFVRKHNVGTVINCAAFTDVDKAETMENVAELINSRGPEVLASVMKSVDGVLLHVSTDYVYNGDTYTPHTEEEFVSPENVYGKTKLDGEVGIIRSGCRYMIFRTQWLYSDIGKNFYNTMLSLNELDSISVVYDQIGSPTSAYDLGKTLIRCAEDFKDEFKGIYNYSNNGVCSWYDFAFAIFNTNKVLKHRSIPEVIPVTTNEYNKGKKTADRPYYSVMSKKKAEKVLGRIPHWTESLQQVHSFGAFELLKALHSS